MQIVSETALASRLAAIPPGPRVVASGNFATPSTVLGILDKAVAAYRLNMLNAQPGIPDRNGAEHETSFVGAGMRSSADLHYVPSRLSLVPRLFEAYLPPDVVLLHTSTPRSATVSLGVEVNVLPAAIEQVRQRGGVVVAQLNPAMPYTLGDAVVPTEHIDYALEAEEPLASPAPIVPDDDARAIGEQVARRVPEGSAVQAGIGTVPNSVLAGLSAHRGLSVWTEMFSDGVLDLARRGVLDDRQPLVASFVFGSRELYDWVDGNERVHLMRTETTNNPGLIRTRPSIVSINTALQVDLFGQSNASRVGRRIYSGIGGQVDFIEGALHAPGGQAVIALRSWHPRAQCSAIVPMVDEPVTSFQMSSVVTEQGAAEIFGRDQGVQAYNLIERAAHPSVREELREEARALRLL